MRCIAGQSGVHESQNVSDRNLVAFFSIADTDKRFPVIGFGGKLGPDQPASHAFAVNFQEDSPEVDGMAGVLQVGTKCRQSRNRYFFSRGSVIGREVTCLTGPVTQVTRPLDVELYR